MRWPLPGAAPPEWAACPGKRRVLAANLAHALDAEPDAPIGRRAVRCEIVNEARRSADFLWSVAHPEDVLRGCRVEGMERLTEVLGRGRGALLVAPHLGGWEVVLPLIGPLAGVEVAALVEDDWVAPAVARDRRRAQLQLIPCPLRRGGRSRCSPAAGWWRCCPTS